MAHFRFVLISFAKSRTRDLKANRSPRCLYVLSIFINEQEDLSSKREITAADSFNINSINTVKVFSLLLFFSFLSLPAVTLIATPIESFVMVRNDSYVSCVPTNLRLAVAFFPTFLPTNQKIIVSVVPPHDQSLCLLRLPDAIKKKQSDENK